MARAVGYANTKTDYVREGAVNRMKSLTIEKGLLMETRAIHDQMRALLRCNVRRSVEYGMLANCYRRLLTSRTIRSSQQLVCHCTMTC